MFIWKEINKYLPCICSRGQGHSVQEENKQDSKTEGGTRIDISLYCERGQYLQHKFGKNESCINFFAGCQCISPLTGRMEPAAVSSQAYITQLQCTAPPGHFGDSLLWVFHLGVMVVDGWKETGPGWWDGNSLAASLASHLTRQRLHKVQ